MFYNFKKSIRKFIVDNTTDCKEEIYYPYREYLDKYKCIFIHLPKVAGTSVLSKLAGEETIYRDHCSFREFLAANPKKYNHYYKFCFVRNPTDRIKSVYKYWCSGGNKKDDLYFKSILDKKYPSFEEFVINYLNPSVIYEHRLLTPQYIYIYNHKLELMVDFVGKHENLDRDFDFVCKRLGLPPGLPKKNVTPTELEETSKLNLTPEAQLKIKSIYEKDFALFDYKN